ncbi:hypothetical protein [Salinigranum sp.]|uniref:hypothetical protein n=1 Tax=Salinigranum sp. TaxID=1966351 RepID=UPI003568119C
MRTGRGAGLRERRRRRWTLFTDCEAATTTVLTGGFLTFFSALVVTRVVVLGYVVRVLRAVDGGERAPTFDRVRPLLVAAFRTPRPLRGPRR